MLYVTKTTLITRVMAITTGATVKNSGKSEGHEPFVGGLQRQYGPRILTVD